MMPGRAFALICVVALTSACASQPVPIVTLGVFDPDEVAYIHENGPNTISGQAFLRQRGGAVVTCAGAQVVLIPRGAYAEERMRNTYGTTLLAAQAVALADEPDPRYRRHTRQTVCDAEGNFSFEGLADGGYFVVTIVTWEAPVGYEGAMVPQGGAVMAPVEVRGGETVRVIVAP